MKKLILLSVFTLLISLSSQAKGMIEFGVKGGVMLSTVDMPSQVGTYQMEATPKLGYQFGLAAKVSFLSMHVQPEILYTLARYKVGYAHTSVSDATGESTLRVNTVDVPVMFGYSFWLISLNAGPVFNIATSSSVKDIYEMADGIITSRPLVGYAAGASVNIKGFVLDARYNGYFKKSEQTSTVYQEVLNYDLGLSSWIFTLGYMF
ncbi:MAG: porin family protein [Rikenellaceae bacterium]